MRARDALKQARARLGESGVEEPGFEAEFLLRHALGCTREDLLMGLDSEASPSAQLLFKSVIERRSRGEPSAYIIGHKEFYGLDFKVDPRALIPRPETELLVELALAFAARHGARGEGLKIDEVGVGCGAISVALAVRLPGARIVATDISTAALELARENIVHHGVEGRVTLLESDLLGPVNGPIDILVSNPPYVRSGDISGLEREIRDHEPLVALDGGPDGMAVIDRLMRQARDRLAPGGAMFIEIGCEQGKEVTGHARHLWPDAQTSITPDLADLDRVLTLYTPLPIPQPT